MLELKSNNPNGYIMIEHTAKLENLEGFVEEVGRQAADAGLSAAEITRMELCVEEVVVNIINYAYTENEGSLRMNCSKDSAEFVITIEDKGIPFNMLEKEDPNVDAPADEREIGGLGVFLVKELMDEVIYSRENGVNTLVLKKHL